MKYIVLLIITLGSLSASDVYSRLMHLASEQMEGVFNESLSPEEQAFYNKLSSDRKRAFLSLNKEEKVSAMAMTQKYPAQDALHMAMEYDVKTLPLAQQAFYHRLSDKGKRIFFILGESSSEQAALWGDTMTADEAIVKALDLDLAALIPEQTAFYKALTPDNQLLYLSLSDRSQENLALDAEAIKDPNKAVLAAQDKDAARLYADQKAFYDQLNAENRPLFLSLTPDARGLAVSLTRGIDAGQAVDYLVIIKHG